MSTDIRVSGMFRTEGWGATQVQKAILLDILKQNEFTSHFSLDRVNDENASFRLNDQTASIGFIFRHIGETLNLFGALLGVPTDVVNTTMGKTDDGQVFDVQDSRELIARGYGVLRGLVESSADEDWLKPVDTPFFGTVTRIRLFAHTLFHTSNHAGQISLTLARGIKRP
jgi:DinB superfamily